MWPAEPYSCLLFPVIFFLRLILKLLWLSESFVLISGTVFCFFLETYLSLIVEDYSWSNDDTLAKTIPRLTIVYRAFYIQTRLVVIKDNEHQVSSCCFTCQWKTVQFNGIFIWNIRSGKLFGSSVVMVWWRNIFKWMRWSQLRDTVAVKQLICPPWMCPDPQRKSITDLHGDIPSSHPRDEKPWASPGARGVS